MDIKEIKSRVKLAKARIKETKALMSTAQDEKNAAELAFTSARKKLSEATNADHDAFRDLTTLEAAAKVLTWEPEHYAYFLGDKFDEKSAPAWAVGKRAAAYHKFIRAVHWRSGFLAARVLLLASPKDSTPEEATTP